jgi:hypothetical protein
MKRSKKKAQAAKSPSLEQTATTFLKALQFHAANAPELANFGRVLMTALCELKNSEARQSLPVMPCQLPRPENLIYRRLHDEILAGIGLQPDDVIVIEPHQPLDQGDLVAGIILESQTYAAGYYYPLKDGACYVLGASNRVGYWHFQPSEIEILGRVIAFDAFYGIEDLETGGETR